MRSAKTTSENRESHLFPWRNLISLKVFAALSVLFAGLLSLGASCGNREIVRNEMKQPEQEPVRITEPILLGYSVQNRPIEAIVMGDGEETLLVLATIHGDEHAGTPLTYRLTRHLRDHPQLLDGRRIVMVPVVNPDGFADQTRVNARGVDLNRNFQAENRENSRRHGLEALSEPEARVIDSLLSQYKPARILSMHEPLNVIDWDGPAEELARHMGQHTELPVERLGGRPGSLGSHAGITHGIPIITLEFPRGSGNQDPDYLWNEYGAAIVSFVTYPQ